LGGERLSGRGRAGRPRRAANIGCIRRISPFVMERLRLKPAKVVMCAKRPDFAGPVDVVLDCG
jgi:hypothetical protein